MAETVLVTGGSGFVAGWCIVELLKRGYLVRTTIRDLSREAGLRSAIAVVAGNTDNLSFVVADLLADAGWEIAMQGCDYVLHVASPLGGGEPGDKHAFLEAARAGTLRVLRAAIAADVKRVVMTSAAAAARPPLSTDRISDETIWANPDDPQFDAYRVSKILAERAAWDFMEGRGKTSRLTTVLPGAVFGPVLFKETPGSAGIIQDLLQGRPRAMPRLGFWVVDVRDLAELHIKAMISPGAAGERFIAAGEFMWMEDIARALRVGLGSSGLKTPTRRLPTILVRLLLPFLPKLKSLAPLIGRKFRLTSEKAQRLLGFTPRPGAVTVVDCAESLLKA
ncbi:SDR family oxidoreductase [Rhizobium leguminosarum]|uniref:SDR family oxidoreductase n=1 Tax=Rhizobium leguminosarum TaxID=384 RepID=UPI003F9C9DAB